MNFVVRQGQPKTEVDPGKFTFVNHGCNGTSNSDFVNSSLTELTADPYNPPAEFDENGHLWNSVYNPTKDRATLADSFSHRDIKKGDEILGNYLTYLDAVEDWESGVLELRSDCAGLLGVVEQYQGGEKLLYADTIKDSRSDNDEL